MSVLLTILFIGLLIFIHEAGHFAVAKFYNIKVNEFSIGMGPAVITKNFGETKYSFRVLPLGGYVALEGESEESDDNRALCNMSANKRLLLYAAGGLMNILLAIMLAFIASIMLNSNIIEAITQTFVIVGEFFIAILKSIGGLLTGIYTLKDLTGPVGIATSSSQVLSLGVPAFILFMSMLSLNLGIINLIPFPGLDGGKILFVFIEKVFGKKISPVFEDVLTIISTLILFGVIILITLLDIARLFG